MRNVLFFLTIALIVSCRYVTIVYYTPPEEPKIYEPQWEWIDPIDPGLNPINNGQLLITPNENLRVTPYTLEGISFDTLNIDR